MRVRVPMRRLVLFLSLLGVALLVFLPMRLVLGAIDGGFAAREASGSVWAGSLNEAQIGPVGLGDLNARLSPLSLLAGRARVAVERPSAAPDRFAGALVVARNLRAAESVTGSIAVDGLFGPLPIGSFELTDVTARFRDGQCERAAGLVKANLSGGAGSLPLPATLSGAARCDRGALLLPLASGGGEALALRITGDGGYQADVTVRAAEPALVERLTGLGFAPGPGGYVLSLEGRL